MMMERGKIRESDGILFLLQTHQLWNFRQEGEFEVFYDPLQRRIVFLQLYNVYAFEGYCKTKDSNPVYFKLPYKCKKADALAISHDDRCLAIQEDNLKINFIEFENTSVIPSAKGPSPSPGTRESCVAISSSKVRILGLCFMQSRYFDFVICHCKGFEVYKYISEKKQLKSLKSVSYNTMNVFINPLTGVIVMSSSGTRGEMQLYNLNKDEAKLKSIKIGNFSLQLWTSEIQNLPKAEIKARDARAQKQYCEIPQILTKNLRKYYEDLLALNSKRISENSVMHKLVLSKCYSKNILLHYNQSNGILHLYRLHLDKIERHLNSISLDPAPEYSLQVCDNLLLITNLSTGLLSIYDSKSSNMLKDPLFTNGRVDWKYSNNFVSDNIEDSEAIGNSDKSSSAGYIFLHSSTEFSALSQAPVDLEEEDTSEEPSNSILEFKYYFEDDNLPLAASSSDKVNEEVKAQVEFSPSEVLYIDSDLVYDIVHNRCFTYLFNKGKYLKIASKKIPGLINLMRRQKPKGIIFPAIRHLMTKLISLHKLSKLFERINEVYKSSQAKRVATVEQCPPHEVKRVTMLFPLVEKSIYQPGIVKPIVYWSKSADTDGGVMKDERVVSGEIIIPQKEMVECVFKIMTEDEDFSKKCTRYLINAMVEYHRSLISFDIFVELNTQSHLVKYLIEQSEFQYLHMLLQYQSFSDSAELAADLLRAVEKGYQPAFQLVVDMHHRQRRYSDAITTLLEADRIQEAIVYVEKLRLKSTSAKNFLKAAYRLPESQRVVYIEYFSRSAEELSPVYGLFDLEGCAEFLH